MISEVSGGVFVPLNQSLFWLFSNRALFAFHHIFPRPISIARTHAAQQRARCKSVLHLIAAARVLNHCMKVTFARASSLHHGAIFVRFHRKK